MTTLRLPLLIAASVGLSTLGFAPASAQTQEPAPVKLGTPAPAASPGDPELTAQVLQGRDLLNSGKVAQALDSLTATLAKTVEKGDKANEARALSALAMVRMNRGEFPEAKINLDRALTLAHAIPFPLVEAATLTYLGQWNATQGKFDDALRCFEQASPLIETLPDADGNKLRASCTLGRGTAYYQKGEMARARVLLKQASTQFEEVRLFGPAASCLLSAAATLMKQGDYAEAIPELEQSLLLCRGHDIRGMALAMTQTNLGLCYLEIGRTVQGVETIEQSLIEFRAVGNQELESLALQNLAMGYTNMGLPERANDILEKQLLVSKRSQDRPLLLTQLAKNAEERGDFKAALTYYKKVVVAARQDAVKNATVTLEVNALIQIADLHRTLGNDSLALTWAQNALQRAKQTGDIGLKGDAILCVGRIRAPYASRAEQDRLFDDLKEIQVRYERGGQRRSAILLLNQMGMLRDKQLRWADAEVYFRGAVDQIEGLRRDIGYAATVKSDSLDGNVNVYNNLLRALLRQNKNRDAFEMLQQRKARGVLDLMTRGKADLSSRLTTAERAEEKRLRTQCDTLNAAMIAEGVQNEKGSKKRFEAYKVTLGKAEQELQTFQQTLYARYPALRASYPERAVTLAGIARALPAGTALIEWAELNQGGGLVAFVVTPPIKTNAAPGLLVYRVAGANKDIERHIASVRGACADPRLEWRTEARVLYKLLISPAQPVLANIQRLIICPDARVAGLPFAALLDLKGHSLLSNYEITYAYSATAAQAAQIAGAKTMARRRISSEKTQPLLVVANPDFGADRHFGDLLGLAGQRPLPAPDRPLPAPDRPLPTPDRPLPAADRPLPAADRPLPFPDRAGRLTPLLGTQREADALRRLFPSATILTGNSAQERAIKAALGGHEPARFRFVHLATHGFVNPAAPLQSSLVLADPVADSAEDGLLTAREIMEFDLSDVEMTVLSACNTAQGDARLSEGVVGLTWGLFAAGCPTQVLSQWAVNDASTATLMERFYTHLKAGTRKAEALRQAALSLSKKPETAHPYYWAPFVLFGSGQ